LFLLWILSRVPRETVAEEKEDDVNDEQHRRRPEEYQREEEEEEWFCRFRRQETRILSKRSR